MSIEVTEHLAVTTSGLEKSVVVLDSGNVDGKGLTNGLRIHPWDRYKNTAHASYEVYVSAGWFSNDNIEDEDIQNVIVDRNDFVEAILAVFPELKRADDSA